MSEPSHLRSAPDPLGGGEVTEAAMVDVSKKEVTERSALARARVRFPPGTLRKILSGDGPKGPVTEMARAAGILAAKRTAELIPLCHPLGLDWVEVSFRAEDEVVLEILVRASCSGRTGVEMEALTGASIAALTIYDMSKAVGHGIRIEAVELLEKLGGRSGVWKREEREE